jgi:hypothetical protein
MTVSGINMAYSNNGGIGPQDGDIMVTLKEGHAPTANYVESCAPTCPSSSPAAPSRSCPPTS